MTLSNHPYCEDCTTRPACKRMGCINVPAPSPAAPQAAEPSEEGRRAWDDLPDALKAHPGVKALYRAGHRAGVDYAQEVLWPSVPLQPPQQTDKQPDSVHLTARSDDGSTGLPSDFAALEARVSALEQSAKSNERAMAAAWMHVPFGGRNA